MIKHREIIPYPSFLSFLLYILKKNLKRENFRHVMKNSISYIEITRIKKRMTKAMFSWPKFENWATVALSFLFGN